jgi:peptidylprolyl isomerase
MTRAASGNTVKVHYTAKLDDGTVVDSSREGTPIEITLGGHQVIPGFEEALIGMAAGEDKTAHIPCAKAYGERQEHLVFEVPRSMFPPDIRPEQGMTLRMTLKDGHSLPAVVVAATAASVTLDANHRMAGKDLVFDLHLVGVSTVPSSGHSHGGCGCGHDHG